MKNLTIGITISLKKDNIWNNGIAQNVINFAKSLLCSNNDYTVMILNTSDVEEMEYKIDGIMVKSIKDAIDGVDLLFILGSQISDAHYNIVKKNNTKLVYYSCGANYFIDTQHVLFGDSNADRNFYYHIPDEIWVIPQNFNSNRYYFQTLYRTKTISIPFVWSPLFIDYVLDNFKIKGFYEPKNEPKNISCFEPNIDIVKYALYDILIVEQAYREKPNLIKHFYITNSEKIKNNKLFISTMQKLDIVNNKIATFESRFRMPYFLDKYTDVVIAHQVENPLNYAYLDALYLNYPLVHNASLIKDAGYYYDGFDVETGKNMLLYALEQHDKNIEEYNNNSKKVLNRYMYNNEDTVIKYDELIDNLFKNK